MKEKCDCVYYAGHERIKIFLISLSSFLILAILCFFLYSWTSGADFIFSLDFPFFKSREIKGVNTVGINEPLEYSDGVTITAKEVYLSKNTIKIKTEIENNTDNDIEFSSLQFELTVQRVGQRVAREYYSPSYTWYFVAPKGSTEDFVQTFPFEGDEDCSFSLSIYNEKNEKAGQILFALSDIKQGDK